MRPVMIFIIFQVAVGIAAIVFTVNYAHRYFDGTVVEDNYKAGVAWEAEQAKLLELGWQISWTAPTTRVVDHAISVQVLDKNANPIKVDKLELVLSRPATADHDTSYSLTASDSTAFTGAIDIDMQGYWMAHFHIEALGEAIELVETLYIRADQ